MAQIKKGVDLASFPIRRTREILAMLMIQVTLNLDDVMKMFVQVIKMLDEYSYAMSHKEHILEYKGILIMHNILL